MGKIQICYSKNNFAGENRKGCSKGITYYPAGGKQVEEKRTAGLNSEFGQFINIVDSAKKGDKDSMEQILDLFNGEIEYLAKFIMLPREEAVQELKVELINIIHERL